MLGGKYSAALFVILSLLLIGDPAVAQKEGVGMGITNSKSPSFFEIDKAYIGYAVNNPEGVLGSTRYLIGETENRIMETIFDSTHRHRQ